MNTMIMKARPPMGPYCTTLVIDRLGGVRMYI
jgi:hypothetical protein